MNTRLLMPALLCAAAASSGCNLMAESDWHQATLANTIAGYATFLQEHPRNKHADNARGRILALRDEQAWSTARAANTIAAYDGYLKAWSGGVHAGDAEYQITALQRAAAWKSLQNEPSAASLHAFLLIYPQGRESNEARAKLKELYSTCATLGRSRQSCKFVQEAGADSPPASLSATSGSASLSRSGLKRVAMSWRAAM